MAASDSEPQETTIAGVKYTAVSTESKTTQPSKNGVTNRAFPQGGKIGFMLFSLVAGIACALGQHFFYSQLDGKPPPESSWHIAHGVSKQKVNIAVGNALAFFTKAFLAMAVAAAHDQISWKSIKNHPTEVGLINALFASREDWISAVNMRMWLHMPFAAFLVFLFWLLQLAPLITPSALTIRSAWLNTTDTARVPRIDFTSMNFPTVSWGFTDTFRAMDKTEWQQTSVTYSKPQYPVQKAVQGSLISNNILSITAPSSNTSWSIQFYGPTLKCTSLHDTKNATLKALRSRIYRQYAEAWNYGGIGIWMSYLSWLPSGTGINSSLPFTEGVNSTYTPRAAIAGGEPLSLYIMSQLPTSPSGLNYNSTANDIVPYMESNNQLWLMELQNVSYNVDFSFPDGAQEIKIKTSEPLNSVNYLSGFSTFVATSDITYNPNLTRITLNDTVVKQWAYQSVFDAFAAMFVGNATITTETVGNDTSTELNMLTSIAMTPLIQAKELRNISQTLELQNSNLGNVEWNGKSVNQNQTTSRGLVDLVEEMFHNVTISLMNEAALNPDYESMYAPSEVNVQNWISQSVYGYSASTLWITYAIAILISTLCVAVGAMVVLGTHESYTSEFSTFVRVAQDIHLSSEIAPADRSGKDPLPQYLKKAVVRFPQTRKD